MDHLRKFNVGVNSSTYHPLSRHKRSRPQTVCSIVIGRGFHERTPLRLKGCKAGCSVWKHSIVMAKQLGTTLRFFKTSKFIIPVHHHGNVTFIVVDLEHQGAVCTVRMFPCPSSLSTFGQVCFLYQHCSCPCVHRSSGTRVHDGFKYKLTV